MNTIIQIRNKNKEWKKYVRFVLSLIATNYLFNWYYRVKPEKVRCQEHIPIILQSEDVEDHLLEKVKSSQETPKNEQVCIDL